MSQEANTWAAGLVADTQRIKIWLAGYISNLTEIPDKDIDMHAAFDCYGFDSYQGVVMTCELGEWLGLDLDPSDVFDHPSIHELAEYLVTQPKIRSALQRFTETAAVGQG